MTVIVRENMIGLVYIDNTSTSSSLQKVPEILQYNNGLGQKVIDSESAWGLPREGGFGVG